LIEVYDRLHTIAMAGGEGAVLQKTTILANLLTDLSAKEARYVLRIPLGHLRLGIGDPTVMDGCPSPERETSRCAPPSSMPTISAAISAMWPRSSGLTA